MPLFGYLNPDTKRPTRSALRQSTFGEGIAGRRWLLLAKQHPMLSNATLDLNMKLYVDKLINLIDCALDKNIGKSITGKRLSLNKSIGCVSPKCRCYILASGRHNPV